MPIHVQVGLLSGRAATVEADLDEEVGSLKRRAKKELGVGRGRLMDSSGSILETCTPIKHTQLQDCDSLSLHTGKVQVQANREAFGSAFAAILGDGSVVTWGDAAGGDSDAVQH